MAIVVDASAVGAMLLPEGRAGLAKLAAAAWDDRVHVPVHWPIEIVSLLIKAERTARTRQAQSLEGWAVAEQMIATARVESSVDVAAVWDLVHEYAISAQDAPYLELALRLQLPLLTGDRQLARACSAASIPLPFDPNA